MNAALKKVLRFLTDENGPTAVQYAMMLMLAVLIGLSVLTMIGQSGAGRLGP